MLIQNYLFVESKFIYLNETIFSLNQIAYSLKNNNLLVKQKQETLCLVTMAMICSTLASLWKSQYFQKPIYNPVEDLWWSLYCKNIKPLSMLTKKLHRRCLRGFWIHLCFLKTLQTFYFFKEACVVKIKLYFCGLILL